MPCPSSIEFSGRGVKWIYDFEAIDFLARLKIFTQQKRTRGCLSGGNDQGIPKGKSITILQCPTLRNNFLIG